MESEIAIEKGTEFLRYKEYDTAIRELKKAVRFDAENPKIYFLLAKAYLKLGESENSRPYFLLAEESVRKSLKLEEFNNDYHNLLISIKTKLGTLNELSIEYRNKILSKPNPLYEEMLKKITTISLLSIPQVERGKKSGRAKGAFFLNYVVMPLVVAGVLFVWLDPRYEMFRFPSLLIIIFYFTIKIISKPKSKASNKW